MAASILQVKARLLQKYPTSRLEKLTSAESDRIRIQFPGIPEDFVQYLEVVGHGTIGKWDFMVYSGPVSVSEIYDATTAESLGGIVLVADNFSGDVVGYDTKNQWQIGEIDSSCDFLSLDSGITTFIDMIEDRLLAND